MDKIRTKSFELAIYKKGNTKANKIALVLPGRLDSKDYAHIRSHVDFLADKGFYALSFDMPGAWESPGDIKDYSTTTYIKVVDEVIEHYKKPTLLIGHSRGGAVAMLVGTKNPSVIGMIMVMATYGPPTPASSEAKKLGYQLERRDLPGRESRTIQPRIYKLPIGYFTDSQNYHPKEVLKKSTKPKLLIYGRYDEFTSPEAVKKIFESLPEPKISVELNTDHDYRFYPDMIDKVNSAIADFLKTSVK